jgi:hypothetical protein
VGRGAAVGALPTPQGGVDHGGQGRGDGGAGAGAFDRAGEGAVGTTGLPRGLSTGPIHGPTGGGALGARVHGRVGGPGIVGLAYSGRGLGALRLGQVARVVQVAQQRPQRLLHKMRKRDR